MLASVVGGLVCFLVCAAVALRCLQSSSRYKHDLGFSITFDTAAGKQGQPGSIPIVSVDLDDGLTPLVYCCNGVSSEPDQPIGRSRSLPAEVMVRNEMLATFGESPSAGISAPEDRYTQLENRLAVAPAGVHSAAIQRARSMDPMNAALKWLASEQPEGGSPSHARPNKAAEAVELGGNRMALDPLDGMAELAGVQLSLVEQDMPGSGRSTGARAGTQPRPSFFEPDDRRRTIEADRPSIYGGHQMRALLAMRARSLNLKMTTSTLQSPGSDTERSFV